MVSTQVKKEIARKRTEFSLDMLRYVIARLKITDQRNIVRGIEFAVEDLLRYRTLGVYTTPEYKSMSEKAHTATLFGVAYLGRTGGYMEVYEEYLDYKDKLARGIVMDIEVSAETCGR